jgi:hypothetical protein
MTGMMLAVAAVLAFLPALFPLFYGRIGATIGVALLCIVSFLLLFAFILPGVLLWFAALVVGLWSASDARRDKRLQELVHAIETRDPAPKPRRLFGRRD